MKLAEFDYYLPKELIAQTPTEPRDNSKLMVMRGDSIEHRRFYEIVDYLAEEDTLVLNDTKVIPAKLSGMKSTGGKVEVLILDKLKLCNTDFNVKARQEVLRLLSLLNVCKYRAMVKGKNVKANTEMIFENNIVGKVGEHLGEGNFVIEFNQQLDLTKIGNVPLPPYIKQKLEDRNRYNTVYAKHEGSLAAPTAGLHFTEELIGKIKRKCNIAYITLHIGPGTFLPIRTENIIEHRMEKEWFRVTKENAEIINNTVGRLIAVGTTTVKVLESTCKNGKITPCEKRSDLFIYPGYKFKSKIGGMITNFHLPKSSVLLLTCALADRDKIFNAYREAMKNNYRFYSFGDSMLILK
jgi:S-adenosylmethionine:tRNA ribosyltransferase-isomerase